MRLALPLLVLVVLALAAYAPSPPPPAERALAPPDSEWAWPDDPENLQVLPSDIGASGLRTVMRGFTRSLGVRCHHCHVGEEGLDFLEWDFASDAKQTKEIARDMMRMTAAINTEILPRVEGLHSMETPPAGPAEWLVTCWTCHRGEAHPSTAPPPREGQPSPGEDSGQSDHDHDDHNHDDHNHDDHDHDDHDHDDYDH